MAASDAGGGGAADRRPGRLRALWERVRENDRLGRETRSVVAFAALTGGVTGLAVAGFEWVTRYALFNHLRQAPLAVQVLAPLVGLAIAGLALWRLAAGASPTSGASTCTANGACRRWLNSA